MFVRHNVFAGSNILVDFGLCDPRLGVRRLLYPNLATALQHTENDDLWMRPHLVISQVRQNFLDWMVAEWMKRRG